MATQTRPTRLTPPQIQALRSLRDGWEYTTTAREHRFSNLVWYPFYKEGQKAVSVTGTTLNSLWKHGWTTYEPATLTLAIDGSPVAGYRLTLTTAGQQIADKVAKE